jgi:predicted DNA-binding ribbon-helix-helix protein
MPGLHKRSVSLSGHATSVALETAFWRVLEAMAAAEGSTVAALIVRIDQERGEHPLASALRVAALEWTQARGGG